MFASGNIDAVVVFDVYVLKPLVSLCSCALIKALFIVLLSYALK